MNLRELSMCEGECTELEVCKLVWNLTKFVHFCVSFCVSSKLGIKISHND